MENFKRVALYFLPTAQTARRGAQWLGHDILAQPSDPRPLPTNQPNEIKRPSHWVKTSQKYGFHATLKAPFRLHPNYSLDELKKTLTMFCAGRPSVHIGKMEIAPLGRFLTLRPQSQTPELTELASEIVRHFDPFRAEMTDEERMAWHKKVRTPAALKNALTWGYAHIFDQFRFHLTLTDPLSGTEALQARKTATEHFKPDLQAPWQMHSLSLVGQTNAGVFHQILRCPLQDTPRGRRKTAQILNAD